MKIRSLLLAATLLLSLFPLCAPAEGGNPLIDPEAGRVTEYIALPDRMLNILLLGLDSDKKDYTFRVEESHTDTIILLAVNLDKNRADLISIPRDTLAYVPGTRGVYKINGAINVGGTRAGKPARSGEGFAAVRDTVEWFLGGIRIDHYAAVDMEAMKEIGDELGGVDFDLEMNYYASWGSWPWKRNSGGKRYKAGLQHLDGTGIVDYFRARRNATVQTGSDLARTGRQRELLSALFKKLLGNQKLLLSLVLRTHQNDIIRNGLHTDISATDTPRLLQTALSFLAADGGAGKHPIGSHAIYGTYRNAFGNWKFTFTDMDNRREVVRQVFGVEVSDLDYVSYGYAKWLYDSGFTAIRFLSAADGILNFLEASEGALADTGQARDAEEKLRESIAAVQKAFLTASHSLSSADTKALTQACNVLRTRGDTLAKLIAYPKKGGKVTWRTAKYHDDDPLVNEVYVNFR